MLQRRKLSHPLGLIARERECNVPTQWEVHDSCRGLGGDVGGRRLPGRGLLGVLRLLCTVLFMLLVVVRPVLRRVVRRLPTGTDSPRGVWSLPLVLRRLGRLLLGFLLLQFLLLQFLLLGLLLRLLLG